MAREAKNEPKELTVEQKLKALVPAANNII